MEPLASLSTEAKSVAAWAKAAPERPSTMSEDRTIFFMGGELRCWGDKSGDRLADPRRVALLQPVEQTMDWQCDAARAEKRPRAGRNRVIFGQSTFKISTAGLKMSRR